MGDLSGNLSLTENKNPQFMKERNLSAARFVM
jgi:hypothetical protein